MKHMFLIFALVVTGCVSEPTLVYDEEPEAQSGNAISEHEAMRISAEFRKDASRSSLQATNVQYIFSSSASNYSTSSMSASSSNSVVLAYVFNYGVDDGFTIVSADNRVYPILAYSDKGSFEISNDPNHIVDINFINNIEPYLASIEEGSQPYSGEIEMPECVVREPEMGMSWGQRSPWDKYVIEEHPLCPTGCVAVATGQLMCMRKDRLNYHDINFDFKAMRNAIEAGPTTVIRPRGGLLRDSISVGDVGMQMLYTTAVDYAAKLLYFIGKDVGMNYTPDGSGAPSYKAYNLMRSLGYNMGESSIQAFDKSAIARKVRDGSIIYFEVYDRRDNDNIVGHAWVVDGVQFCYAGGLHREDETIEDIENGPVGEAFFHCNWGWAGQYNGFYSADVFSVIRYEFKGTQYFSIVPN